MPREHPVTVSPEEVRRTLGDLESQRSQQRRSYQRPSPLIRVPHDEILRVLHDIDRQRAKERSRHPEQPIPETTPRRASALHSTPNAAKTLPYKTHAAASDCITETT
ncbi:hypothetical protein HRG_000418 [Hirsutella rhossiliensis]|uniref:Uncharacterized protein n=1 Tax=Hirsutella rhossiliensis TaxID=111463 RepID=A0A9P8SP32_9HYPO|nr:uncharacterized protein HRG_00418 [Hirsutella rhossiliensis]KAH0967776.1 hypothetical protein HRG_00418 [Hirsutella rhossiliensis]